MTLEEECILSYYREIAEINGAHNVWLVQHVESKKIFVKKILNEYSRTVYEYIKNNKCPNFPVIYECIEDNRKLILIEEYINGRTLSEILREETTMSVNDTIAIVNQICMGLDFLHSATPQIVHRDIKPDNIMITGNGNIKLIDVNIAKTHKENEKRDTGLFGTEGYAAPEQYGFGQSDARADIYAVGVLINVMLTGCFPYEDKVTGRIGNIVDKCIRMDPSFRYNSVKELLLDLNGVPSYEQENNVPKQDKYTAYGKQKTVKKKTLFFFAGIICIAAIFFALSFRNNKRIAKRSDNSVQQSTSQSDTDEEKISTLEETLEPLPDDTDDEKYRRGSSGRVIKFTREKWPQNGIAKSIPVSDAEFLNISIEQHDTFSVNMIITKAQYDSYVEACIDAGYDKKYHKGDTYYSGENSDGNKLSISFYEDKGYVHLNIYNWS